MLFLPWYHASTGALVLYGGQASYSASATSSSYAALGVLAVLLTIAVVVDGGLARFSPQTQILATQLVREKARTGAAAVALLLLVIKLTKYSSYLGFGAYLGVALAVAVTAATGRVIGAKSNS